MQTPPSSPTSGKFKLFYYNVRNVSFAANFKLQTYIGLHWFSSILFITMKKLLTLPLCFYPKIYRLHHLHQHQVTTVCSISMFSVSVLEQILNCAQTYLGLHCFFFRHMKYNLQGFLPVELTRRQEENPMYFDSWLGEWSLIQIGKMCFRSNPEHFFNSWFCIVPEILCWQLLLRQGRKSHIIFFFWEIMMY